MNGNERQPVMNKQLIGKPFTAEAVLFIPITEIKPEHLELISTFKDAAFNKY